MTTFHQDFAVIKKIGKGTFAKVYMVSKRSSGVIYAVKVFDKQHMSQQPLGQASLINEIKIIR